MTIIAAPNQPDSIKIRLEKLDATQLEQLQNVYQYRSVRSLAQSTGRVNLFTGVLTLWLGLAGIHFTIFHLIQTIAGILLLAISIWAVAKPSLQVIRAFAWVFLGCAIWNLFLVVQDNFQGLSWLIGLLGIAQLWWAYQFYRTYHTHSTAKLPEPANEVAETYDQIWEAIAHTNLQQDSDFIEFQTGPNRWRGWLLGDLAIFALKKRRVVYLSRENNVAFSPHVAKIGKKKRFYISVKFDDISAQGFIKRASFDRYAQWKLRNHPHATAEDFQLTGTGKVHWLPFGYLHPIIRIPILIISALLLFYIIFLIVGLIHYNAVGW